MSDLPVLYESDGRLARITLNRPEVLNAIDDTLPAALESAVKRANSDQNQSNYFGRGWPVILHGI